MMALVLVVMPCVQHKALGSAVLHVAPFEMPRDLQMPTIFVAAA